MHIVITLIAQLDKPRFKELINVKFCPKYRMGKMTGGRAYIPHAYIHTLIKIGFGRFTLSFSQTHLCQRRMCYRHYIY